MTNILNNFFSCNFFFFFSLVEIEMIYLAFKVIQMLNCYTYSNTKNDIKAQSLALLLHIYTLIHYNIVTQECDKKKKRMIFSLAYFCRKNEKFCCNSVKEKVQWVYFEDKLHPIEKLQKLI